MIRIGTRQSRLALAQAEIVRSRILQCFPHEQAELVRIVTKGDRETDKSLASFGGKGVFTKEIEDRLLDGTIDLAVHSAKDMPLVLPAGLVIGAVVEREDPRDVIITRTNVRFCDLPNGARAGTSSLRRELQLRRMHPGIDVVPLRGNVLTRLAKLRDGQYDAIVLAAAGIKRLQLDSEADLHYEYMDTQSFIPAAGQGILALEIREGTFGSLMQALHEEEAALMLKAERAFLKRIDGSCNAPAAVCCHLHAAGCTLQAMYAPDGKHLRYRGAYMPGRDCGEACRLACELADDLKGSGSLVKRVSLVGAGPGRYELLTQKALECVKTADVILYDNLISPSILNEARLDCELIYTGKRQGAHACSQEEINALLAEKAKEGRYVVRLKGGDPFVFGRGGEEALALKQENVPYEVVPGVSSAYSVLAYAGIPVTHRGIASSFHVVTGHSKEGKIEADYELLAKEEGTLVILMGFGALGMICSRLIQCGKAEHTPAAVIQSGATAHMRVVSGTLANLEQRAKAAGLGTPAVIVVGEVVSLAGQIGWQEKLPLSGRRILLTGTRRTAGRQAQLLEALGAEAVRISLIETQLVWDASGKEKLTKVSDYDWIVFTSAAGVHAFFAQLKELGVDCRKLAQVQFAVIGESTAAELASCGYQWDFMPSQYQSDVLAREWIPQLRKGEHVLLVQGRQASRTLLQELEASGVRADAAVLYDTVCDMRRKEELKRAAGEADYVVVASGTAVRALVKLLEGQKVTCPLVAIGSKTQSACEESGLRADCVAQVQTAEGLADVICREELR